MKRGHVRLDLTLTEARALTTLLKSVGPDPGWMIENLLDYLDVAVKSARRARETVDDRIGYRTLETKVKEGG